MMASLGGDAKIYFGDLECNLSVNGGTSQSCTPGNFERLKSQLDSFALDWTLLFKALPELFTYVENKLDGAASNIHVPIVGDALDGGAEIAKNLKEATELITDVVKPEELKLLRTTGALTSYWFRRSSRKLIRPECSQAQSS